jgi:hypothetical protein
MTGHNLGKPANEARALSEPTHPGDTYVHL